MKILGLDDVKDLIVGATVLGVGGGGSPDYGFKILMDDLNRGLKLKISSFDELDLDAYVATPYFAGSMPAPDSKMERKSFSIEVMLKAIKILEDVIGRRIKGFVPTEIGGGNTALALHIASLLGLPLLDGDQAGRSVPELIHNLYYVNGVPLTPSVVATVNGDYIIFKEYSSIESYENIVRLISSQISGSVFVVDSPVMVELARKIVVNDSVSMAMEIGRSINEAKLKGLDPAYILAEKLNGFIVFEGFIDRCDLKVERGFLLGYTYIRGIGDFKNRVLKIFVKNENIMAWVDDEPIIMPPDLIILMGEDGYAIVNSNIKVGLKVKVVAAPSPPQWRVKRGIEILGPRHFGFQYDYKPVEDILSKYPCENRKILLNKMFIGEYEPQPRL